MAEKIFLCHGYYIQQANLIVAHLKVYRSFFLSGGTQLGTVSWEHFFASLNQYYASLRQEVPQTAYPGFARGAPFRTHGAPMTALRSITPQEVDGLRAVLALMATVVKQVRNCVILLPVILLISGILWLNVPNIDVVSDIAAQVAHISC
jgi:hypothetical protein